MNNNNVIQIDSRLRRADELLSENAFVHFPEMDRLIDEAASLMFKPWRFFQWRRIMRRVNALSNVVDANLTEVERLQDDFAAENGIKLPDAMGQMDV